MAATLAAQYAAAQLPAFQNQVQMAMLNAAQAIAAEPTNTANHPRRVALALQIAGNPTAYVPGFAGLLAAQAIDNGSTDVAIQNMVNSVWNTAAGVP